MAGKNMSVETLAGEADDSPLTILKTFLAKQDLPSANTVGGGIGIAVSGGGDSMALLVALAAHCGQTGTPLHAATVHHHLRPEADDDIALVQSVCADLSIPHAVLSWQDWDGQGNLQAQARMARRHLIAEWARGLGLSAVLIAHTADDVIETFVIRLARGSGVDGLAIMRDRFLAQGVLWLRPFLAVSRAALRDYLREKNVSWAEDSTNEDEIFERVRVRKALPKLAKLGIDPARIYTTAQDLAGARQALDYRVRQLMAAYVRSEKTGSLRVDWQGLSAEPFDFQRRVLMQCFGFIAGAGYPPRATAMTALFQHLTEGKRSTLAGCIVGFVDGSVGADLEISREPKAMPICDISGGSFVYDNNWQIEITGEVARDMTRMQLRPLAETGILLCKNWRDTGLSRQALAATPALWQGDNLIAAPFLPDTDNADKSVLINCVFNDERLVIND